MSNFDIIKAHYEASTRGDLEGMLAPLGPDTKWTEMDGFPCAGTYTGPDEVKENVFFVLGRDWDGTFKHELESLHDAGDTVVAVGNYSATHPATGKSFQARVVHVWTFRDGQVVGFEQFCDTLKVAEAMQ